MEDIILKSGSSPVYTFLAFIEEYRKKSEVALGKKILDCGAGGTLPPLSLFRIHGFDTWGIDISDKQLEKALEFCKKNKLELRLHRGDMRQIPFKDQTFDYVYEYQSMCHLTKSDIQVAVREMHRVLKKSGLCFLGLISRDTMPIRGREIKPGEYFSYDEGSPTIHSAYSEDEVDNLFSSWEIMHKEKRTLWSPERLKNISLKDWMDLREEFQTDYPEDDWKAIYKERLTKFQYTHIYYILKKPQ